MNLILTTEAPNEEWGNNALITFNNNSAQIHVKDENDFRAIQQAARKLRNQGIDDVEMSGDNWQLEQAWAFYQGYYTAKQNFGIEFGFLTDEDQNELLGRLACGDFVREIINLPAEIITPVELAKRAVDFIKEQADEADMRDAIHFNIIQGKALSDEKINGIWAVGKGSKNKPALLELDFNPTGDKNAPVLACLVGKGITFDTGGYSLKPSSSMDSMRSDMGGAALLTGALGLAINRGLKQRVKLYLCCAENMVSGKAMRLGDIIEYSNGVSVEVLNTDAEGRLVLADGLIRASQQNPQYIIDCATLTGAAKMAVGNDYHSVLSMDDKAVGLLMNSAKAENEAFWRLPFEEFHRKQVNSNFADIANISSMPAGSSAGASTATAFLSYFVENPQQNWLHIDCSATFRKSASDLWL